MIDQMNTSNDLVSIIIPIYNSEQFLKESLESVINQTYTNIEIICVDDGSNDGSLDILQNYSDKISIISKSNEGLASSLNIAIKKMKGKWFKWLSPDDILYPNCVDILVQEAKKLKENTILYSNWEIINAAGKKLRDFQESNYNNLNNFEFNVRLLDGQQINVNTTLIPSSLFEKGCMIEKVKDPVAIDYNFFLKSGLLYGTSFHLIPQFLLKYRINSEQLSHKNISKTLSYLSVVREDVLSKLSFSTKNQYITALENYRKKKPIQKKGMEFGLKFAKIALPEKITDNLILFYLNNIRRHR